MFQDKNLFQARHAITGLNIILELHTLLHPTNKQKLIQCPKYLLQCTMFNLCNVQPLQSGSLLLQEGGRKCSAWKGLKIMAKKWCIEY